MPIKVSLKTQSILVVKAFFLSTLTLLFACQATDSVEREFEDYAKRLTKTLLLTPDWDEFNGRALDAQLTKRKQPDPQEHRHWTINKQAKTSLWSYITLDDCDTLKQLIAQRNNQLGQHQPPALRLHHETQVRYALKDCANQQNNEQSREKIQALLEIKNTSLQADLWNPIFAKRWFSEFTYSHRAIDFNDRNRLVATAQGLEFVAAQTQTALKGNTADQTASASEWLQGFKSLEGYKTLGQLGRSLIQTTHYLNTLTHWVANLDTAQYCPATIKRKEHTYFKNVVVNVFAGRIQPYLSYLSRDGGRMLIAMDALLQQFDAQPGVANYWQWLYQSEQSIWHQYQQAVKRHAEAISLLNDTCRFGITG